MIKRSSAIAAWTGVLLMAVLPTVHAQNSTEDGSTVTYPASYFSAYNPLTVNDMLDRVPGISLILQQGLDSTRFDSMAPFAAWVPAPRF